MNFKLLTSSNANDESASSVVEKVLKSQVVWIALAIIVFLFLLWYFVKRFYRVPNNKVAVISRKKQIHKVLYGNNKSHRWHFLVPFLETVGGEFEIGDNLFLFDNLQVNDGPDKLYRIDITMVYEINDIDLFYKFYAQGLSSYFSSALNDIFRNFVYEGNGKILLNTYRENESLLVKTVNDKLSQTGINVKGFKVNTILLVGSNY